MKNEQSPELLTVEQFAQRLQVSRATVFSWIQKQIFVQGRHFLKIGRVLRFTWSDDFISLLLKESAASAALVPSPLRLLLLPAK